LIRIAIIGDFDAGSRTHLATNDALQHVQQHNAASVECEWIGTERIEAEFPIIKNKFNGFWIAPGSPYKNMQGALQVIQYARENRVPLLGTCGGFQHMVIEFARNVLHIRDAQHAEYDPYASELVVSPLTCSLKGQPLAIDIVRKMSATFRAYQADKIYEKYYCNFGLNPKYQQQIHYEGFRVVGTDVHKEARILELENHPFFIGTLFVPQDNSSKEKPHPLVTAFVQNVSEFVMVKLN
jgi:CTP synthase (UTP-ammonia lyase)